MRSLPARSLALVATTACGGVDPAIGDWQIDELTLGGLLYELPVEQSEFTRTESFVLEEDGTAGWTRHTTDTTGYGNDTSYTYALTGERVKRGEWTVENEDFLISMTCTASTGEMTCDGTIGESVLVMVMSEASP